MAGSEGPTIRDVIVRQYEANEVYHEHKASSAWTASGVYFTFSLGVLVFLYGASLEEEVIWPAILLCVTVFSSAMSYISLQFSHRWTSVIRTGMFHEVFGAWYSIRTEHDYARKQAEFGDQRAVSMQLGIETRRRPIDIVWLTALLPIVLLLDLAYRAIRGIPSTRFEKHHRDCVKYAKTHTEKTVACLYGRHGYHMYRESRRHVSGLLDSKYRTEIPAYTISFYLLVAQILLFLTAAPPKCVP